MSITAAVRASIVTMPSASKRSGSNAKKTSSSVEPAVVKLVRQTSASSINSNYTDADTDTERDSSSDRAAQSGTPSAAANKEVNLKKILTRSAAATVMALIFLAVMYAGHFYSILTLVLVQCEVYRELVNVRYVEARERQMPWFRTLQWCWFMVPMFYVYGERLHEFCSEHNQLRYFTTLTENVGQYGFVMYCLLFVASVSTLRPGLVKFQISQFMWTILSVCMVVLQCQSLAFNTLNGIFWLFFPMSVVVMNDVSAYFCGITCGRKFIKAPFLALSPNKTWEGFIGAAVLTILFSFFFPLVLSQSTWFTCPAEQITLRPQNFQSTQLSCEVNPVFVFVKTSIPFINRSVSIKPIQIHGLYYGLFASLIAPFGGFFSSAIKRAYKKKDFDSFIPGHGGVMDRMDCHFIMLAFNSFYYRSFISPTPKIASLLFLASMMPLKDQLLLREQLSQSILKLQNSY